MDLLQRTPSANSTSSAYKSHASSESSRKARSVEPDISAGSHGSIERASISMPPPTTSAMHRYTHSRRPSKASDIAASTSTPYNDGRIMQGDGAGQSSDPKDATPANQTAMQQFLKASEADTESNRLSFSSLYSMGSAIHAGSKGFPTSYPSSVAGSDMDGVLDSLRSPTFC